MPISIAPPLAATLPISEANVTNLTTDLAAKIPIADTTGVVIDTTSYPNTFTNVGNLVTVVFPSGTGAIAFAQTGDAHPRLVMLDNPQDGTYWSDGTVDPVQNGAAWILGAKDANGAFSQTLEAGTAHNLIHGDLDANVGPRTIIQNGGLGVTKPSANSQATMISSGIGAPALGGNVGDMYIRQDGADGSWIYRGTVAGIAGAATWVAKL